MSSTPRVAAMAAWEVALRGLTGVRPWGGSYANDPTVERAARSISQVNKFPHLLLLPYEGSRIAAGTQQYYTDHFAAVVIGYVKRTDELGEADLLEHLNRDCKVALLATSQPGRQILAASFDEEDVQFYDSGHAEFWLPFTAQLADALTS